MRGEVGAITILSEVSRHAALHALAGIRASGESSAMDENLFRPFIGISFE
jgi:hypothetical protein